MSSYKISKIVNTSLLDSVPDRPIASTFCMLFSAVCFTFMGYIAKLLSSTFSTSDLIFCRSFICLIISASMLWYYGGIFFPATGKLFLLVRGLAGSLSIYCSFWALSLLPVSLATLLYWSSPLFVVIYSWMSKIEPLEFKKIPWICVAIFGVSLISDAPFSGAQLSEQKPQGIFIACVGAAAAGLAYLALRFASIQFSASTVLFNFALISCLLTFPAVVTHLHIPTMSELHQLTYMGILACLGQIGLTWSYRFTKASVASSLSLVNTTVGVLISIFFFGELLSSWQWLGFFTINLSVLIITLRKTSTSVALLTLSSANSNDRDTHNHKTDHNKAA